MIEKLKRACGRFKKIVRAIALLMIRLVAPLAFRRHTHPPAATLSPISEEEYLAKLRQEFLADCRRAGAIARDIFGTAAEEKTVARAHAAIWQACGFCASDADVVSTIALLRHARNMATDLFGIDVTDMVCLDLYDWLQAEHDRGNDADVENSNRVRFAVECAQEAYGPGVLPETCIGVLYEMFSDNDEERE